MNDDIYLKDQRTEEVQHIIDRIPTRLAHWITLLIVFLVGAIFVLGWSVKYHDVVTGVIVINSDIPPIKLIANGSGKIHLQSKNGAFVREDQYVAYIKNSANVNDIAEISKLLSAFRNDDTNEIKTLNKTLLKKKYSLGEVNLKFYQFLSALNSISNYYEDSLYLKRELNLIRIIAEYERMSDQSRNKSEYRTKYVSFYKRFFQRDSGLLSNKVISEAEFNRSELNYLDALTNKEDVNFNNSQLAQEMESAYSKLKEIHIEKEEKQEQLKLELVTAYSELISYIKEWEEKYVFKSPIDGTIQFARFWFNNNFIQAGDHIFTVISKRHRFNGQLTLPNTGAGKVVEGQEVIIKLDDYPYMEFGSIKGKVKGISLTTRTEKLQESTVETYLIEVELPENLTTSYGHILQSKSEIRGTAEIVTNNRRLIQRAFDNLKYLLKN